MFQHTAARRRLEILHAAHNLNSRFQHTAARRRLGFALMSVATSSSVSTHSRPKAAGTQCRQSVCAYRCFNTQPPEGGWGRCGLEHGVFKVSTHSRPKAAGICANTSTPSTRSFNTQPPEGGWFLLLFFTLYLKVSTHSRPKAAGLRPWCAIGPIAVSTHSRPKAAGTDHRPSTTGISSFNTQPPEGGWDSLDYRDHTIYWFQHTAARRRLVNLNLLI